MAVSLSRQYKAAAAGLLVKGERTARAGPVEQALLARHAQKKMDEGLSAFVFRRHASSLKLS